MAENSNITPGEWNIYRLSPDSDKQERLIVTAAEDDIEICGIVGNEADAHLIAAAPELLHFAEAFIEAWKPGPSSRFDSVAGLAYIAVTKAKPEAVTHVE